MADDNSALSKFLPIGAGAGAGGAIGWLIHGLNDFGINFDALSKDGSWFGLTIFFFMVGVLLVLLWQLIRAGLVASAPPNWTDFVVPAAAIICILAGVAGLGHAILSSGDSSNVIAVRDRQPDDHLKLRMSVWSPSSLNYTPQPIGQTDTPPIPLHNKDHFVVSVDNIQLITDDIVKITECVDPHPDGEIIPPNMCRDLARKFE